MKPENERYEGMWDWHGSCDPATPTGEYMPYRTFSVGCFQWVSRANGKGLKRGRVRYRVKGPKSDPQSVYREAQSFCNLKNSRDLTRKADGDD